jgi:Ca-activated chloride channel homolog
MTNPAFNPDDPRLTAFALGELDGADRAEIEQLIEESPEAAAAVKDIQETIGVLNGELAVEPAPELTEAQRAAILDGETAASSSPEGDSEAEPREAGTVAKVASAAAMAGSVDVNDVPGELLDSPAVRSFPWAIAGSLAASAVVMLAVVSQMPDGGLDDLTSATPSADAVTVAQSDAPAEIAEMDSENASPAGFGGFADEGESAMFEKSLTASSGSSEGAESADRAGAAAPHGFGAVQDDSKQFAQDSVIREERGIAGSTSRLLDKTANALPDPQSRSVRAESARNTTEGGKERVQSTKRLRKMESKVASKLPVTEKSVPQKGGGQSVAAAESPVPSLVPAPTITTSPAKPGSPLFGGTRDKESGATPAGDASRGGLIAGRGRPVAGVAAETGKPAEGLPGQGKPGEGKPGTSKPGEAKPGFSKPGEGKPGQELQVASVARRNRDEALKKVQDAQALSGERKRYGGFGLTPSPTNEAYEPIIENDFVEPDTREKRLSTFSIDVDTASYSNVRRFLNFGQVPPPNAVRIEELVNYFRYDYAEPKDGKPFAVNVELNPCPWAAGHRLARIGIKAKEIDKTKRPPTSLVFMIDVSGSMRSSNKLALVKQSINLLVNELTEDDQVSIVAYANNAGLRLDATSGAKKQDIMKVVNGLTAGGSTNGEGGIRTAYDTAIKHFIQGGSNRVIMCTDGDFNVGVNNDNELVQLIAEKAASGVFLSIFGFGMGNLKDAKLEKLADKGNGQYGYMDNLREAQKVFRDDLMGTLYTIAKDVKIQVEFNPNTVGAYRLIGYENRKLAAQDFNDDTKDAGEIGAGHVVTALYEIVPKKTWDTRPDVGELRYDKAEQAKKAARKKEEKLPFKDELLFVKLNYKNPDEETSTTNPGLHIPVTDLQFRGRTKAPSQDFMWAASVASFGMNLRGSKYSGSWTLADVLETVEGAKGDDELRAEFVELVRRAKSLIGPRPVLRRPQLLKPELTPPVDLTPAEARVKAAVNNKYRRLLKKIEVPNDLQSFGGFYDYGVWEGTSYAGHNDLPANGHWVYVSPHWYIWGDEVKPAAKQPSPEPVPPGNPRPDEPVPGSPAPVKTQGALPK